MHQPTLVARVRKTKGKGAARSLRKNDQVPAVFYGPKTEPIMLAVDYPELNRIIKKGFGENVLLDLQVKSDQGTETRRVVLKELMTDPVKDTFIHVDFYEVAMDKELSVDVPIHLINTPKGVTMGGILQHIRREVTITCMPDSLVDFIELDVSDLDIGDSLHIEDIILPKGIRSEDEGHLTVAVVAAPTLRAEEEAEEEEAVEGEGAALEGERGEE